MKKIILLSFLTVFIVSACNKTDDTPIKSVDGTYTGSFAKISSDGFSVGIPGNATSVVTKTGNELITVHCYGNVLDTTIMLNYYENHDSIIVCLTGNAFNSMYGHMLGQGHMPGGMMGDRDYNETEWEHHMKDEHNFGDVHFGGFDMMNQTFSYNFKMMEGPTTFYMRFTGVKQ